MNESLEVKQTTVENELSSPEGERSFVGRIDRAVIELVSIIKAGRAGAKVRASLENAAQEMQIIADRMRASNARAASFIDEARKKFDGLLGMMDKIS